MNFLDIKSTNIGSYKKIYIYELLSISLSNASPQETPNRSPEITYEDRKLTCARIIRLWRGYWNGQQCPSRYFSGHCSYSSVRQHVSRKGFNGLGSIPDVLPEAWAHSESERCPVPRVRASGRDRLAGIPALIHCAETYLQLCSSPWLCPVLSNRDVNLPRLFCQLDGLMCVKHLIWQSSVFVIIMS